MKKVTTIIGSLMLLVSSAFAQENLGAIKGTVLDPHRAVIPGVVVKAIRLLDDSDKVAYYSKTDNAGVFAFSNLPYGRYRLEAEIKLTGFVITKWIDVGPSNKFKRPSSIALVWSACSDGEENTTPPPVSDNDRLEIVTKVLTLFITQHGDTLFSEQKKQGAKLILFAENIRPDWVSEKIASNFTLKTKQEIQAQADAKGDFVYARLSEFKTKGNCVVISVDNGWAMSKDSTKVYLSGGGFTYEFRRVNGEWVGKLVFEWVS